MEIWSCSGSTDVKNVRTHHLNSSGQHVLAYAAESASATLEDVDRATWSVSAAGQKAIDRTAFGSTIDRSAYHIFLQHRGRRCVAVRRAGDRGRFRRARDSRRALDPGLRLPHHRTSDRREERPAAARSGLETFPEKGPKMPRPARLNCTRTRKENHDEYVFSGPRRKGVRSLKFHSTRRRHACGRNGH